MTADSFVYYLSVSLFESQLWGWLKASNLFWIFSSSLSWNHLYTFETVTSHLGSCPVQWSNTTKPSLGTCQVNLLFWKMVSLLHLVASTKDIPYEEIAQDFMMPKGPGLHPGSHSFPLASLISLRMPHHPHTARLLRAALAFSLEAGLRSWACFVLLSSHLRALYLQVLVTQCNSLTLTFMLVSLSDFLSDLHTAPQRKPHWSFLHMTLYHQQKCPPVG